MGSCIPSTIVRIAFISVMNGRGGGASERELEALALYMGHSLVMQRGTYDRRTKAAKVEPAVDLLHSINTKLGLGTGRDANGSATS
jgi:hypothetical protein